MQINNYEIVHIYRKLFYKYLANLFEPKQVYRTYPLAQNISRNRPKFKYGI